MAETLNIYDAPELVASQLLENEFTTRGIKAAIFDQRSLTPRERETPFDRLREEVVGDSRIGKTLFNIATNPFTWLFFLTSPIGLSSARTAGVTLKDVASKYSAYVSERSPLLRSMLSVGQLSRDSMAVEITQELTNNLMAAGRRYAEGVDPLVQRMKRDLGVRVLDPEQIADATKRERVRRVMGAVEARMAGRDVDWTERTPVMRKGRDGSYRLKMVETHRPRQATREAVDQALGEVDGAAEYVRAMQSHNQWMADELIGTPEKATATWRLLRNRATGGGREGAAIVGSVLGPLAEATATGRVTREAFLEAVEQAVVAPMRGLEGRYFPRNVVDEFKDGVRLEPGQRRGVRAVPIVRAGSSATPRKRVGFHVEHPDDLEHLRQFATDEEAAANLTRSIARSRRAMEEAFEEGKVARVFRIAPARALERHLDASQRTYALTRAPSEGLLEAQRRSVGGEERAREVFDPRAPRTYGGGAAAGTAEVGEVMADVDAARRPIGGFTVADVLYNDWSRIKDPYLRDVMQKVLVPKVLGVSQTKHAAAMNALIVGKKAAKAFVDSDVGKAVRAEGWGKKFIDDMDWWATQPTEMRTASSLSHGTANLLYSSHLGLNVGSVVLNMMQPWLLAAPRLGVPAVMRGYLESFKEMLAYSSERVAQGLKPLSPVERSRLIEKHFRWARGDDVLGIRKNLAETLESVDLRTFRDPYAPPSLGRRLAFEYPMKLFEKAEWINRSTVAHATEHALQGRGVTSDAMRFEVLRSVDATQFGASPTNTPIAMMLGAESSDLSTFGTLLSGPLTRQFLTFPWRSFVASFWEPTLLGGREGAGRVTGLLNDSLRMMGLSAIIYEAGKGLLGADLSRGLAFSAATDILPGFQGGRFDERDSPIPVPPVVDIPASIARALATSDRELMARTLPRLVPGGVALGRTLGAFPTLGVPLSSLQRTSARWGEMTEDGQVPMYRESDNSFVGYQSATDVVLRGLGADLGRYQSRSDLDATLIKNRDLILELRREALRGLTMGEMGRVEAAQRQFLRRFGIPLTVTPQQIRAYQEQRDAPRTERILDRLPPEVRPLYRNMVEPPTSPPPQLPEEPPPAPAFSGFSSF